jgi:hypothetical protein
VEQLARSELVSIKLGFNGAQHAAVDFALPMQVQKFFATTGQGTEKRIEVVPPDLAQSSGGRGRVANDSEAKPILFKEAGMAMGAIRLQGNPF